MFLHGRFDVGIGSRPVVLHYATLLGKQNKVTFLEPPIASELLSLGVVKEKNDNDFATRFAKALASFKEPEEYRQLS